MINLHRIDHVCLRATDIEEAAARWQVQFGLRIVDRSAERITLACDDEVCALELIPGAEPGLDHVGYELARDCTVAQATDHLAEYGARIVEIDSAVDASGGGLMTFDTDGFGVHVVPYREPRSRLVQHARPAINPVPGHPRKLGHVNFLTGQIHEQLDFYTGALGMRLTDWLGDGGLWLHINSDHHVMALINKGYRHFHHLAFDVVDVGQMRDALDHLARNGRWLGWGPTRHGVGGNIASYVRITEEQCFVELYCDMEQLQADHQPREWPDNRFSSNTWGPLPPRSYFRFDQAAIESERESLETQGVPLPPVGQPAATERQTA